MTGRSQISASFPSGHPFCPVATSHLAPAMRSCWGPTPPLSMSAGCHRARLVSSRFQRWQSTTNRRSSGTGPMPTNVSRHGRTGASIRRGASEHCRLNGPSGLWLRSNMLNPLSRAGAGTHFVTDCLTTYRLSTGAAARLKDTYEPRSKLPRDFAARTSSSPKRRSDRPGSA